MSEQVVEQSSTNKFRQALAGVDLRQNGIFLALIALVVFFAATTPNSASITPDNFSNLVVQNGYILVLAIGMVMIIIAGHIDLSVGSLACLIGAVAGIFVVRPLEQDGWGWLPQMPWWLGIVAAIAVGALVGMWQGFWVAYIGIPAFIVTLAGMLLFRGVALMTLQNTNIGPFDDRFRAIGNGFLDKENALGSAMGLGEVNGAALVATAIAILALIWNQFVIRRGRLKYEQPVEPVAWFYSKLVILAVMIGYVGLQLARANGIPITLIVFDCSCCRVQHSHEVNDVRSPRVRDWWQPQCGHSFGHQCAQGELLALREHGRTVCALRHSHQRSHELRRTQGWRWLRARRHLLGLYRWRRSHWWCRHGDRLNDRRHDPGRAGKRYEPAFRRHRQADGHQGTHPAVRRCLRRMEQEAQVDPKQEARPVEAGRPCCVQEQLRR